MRVIILDNLGEGAVPVLVGAGATAQERPAAAAPAPHSTDPRVGLKPGLKEAGQAVSLGGWV